MDLPSGENPVAQAIAQALVDGFNKHYRLFRETSRQAKERFEQGDWAGQQRAVRERIQFYDDRVNECVQRLRDEFQAHQLDHNTWQQAKLLYIGMLTNHKQPELAETFFNSVSCKILHRTYFHNDFIFVRPAVSTEYLEGDPPSYRSYYPLKEGVRTVFVQILRDFDLKVRFADRHRDFRHVLRALREKLPRRLRLEPNHQIQVLNSLFYRNQRAYMIGKIINGAMEQPFVVPIVHDASGR